MTLLFMDGFTNAGITGLRKSEWTGDVSNSSGTTGRDGSTNGAGSTNANTGTFTFPSAAATMFMGMAYNPLVSSDVFNALAGIGFKIGATQHLWMTWDASGYLQIRLSTRTGTVLATATTGQFTQNAWHYVETKLIIHSTTGTCQIKVDGATVINYTGQTGTASGSVDGFIMIAGTTAHNRFAFDDMWICDAVDGTATDGRPNNDFLGDLSVKALRPTAAGDTTQWTPSTGANWAAVDDNPPASTDYVGALAASNLRDLYNVADLPGTGFDTVYAVRQSTFAGKSDAGAATLKQVIKENSVVTLESSVALSTTYGGFVGPMRKVRPSDSAVFTVANVNALQIGYDAS